VAITSCALLGAPSSALSAENEGRLGTLGAIGEIRKSTAKGYKNRSTGGTFNASRSGLIR
jgi:hypothetical protein